MRFFGSAARFPHVDGLFAEFFLSREDNCHLIPSGLTVQAAACAEPLAVVLHAAAHAGSLLGRDVLIIGSGPIGMLAATVARLGGARRICVSDVLDEPLKIARLMGATETLNAGTEQERLAAFGAGAGTFHITFEASGSPHGLAAAIAATAAGGTIVQIGMLPRGLTPAPLNALLAKELRLLGSFRFDAEYSRAVSLLAGGRIDVTPMLTHEFPFDAVLDAFSIAADKRQSMKVSLLPS